MLKLTEKTAQPRAAHMPVGREYPSNPILIHEVFHVRERATRGQQQEWRGEAGLRM
jgi:hypothetical protein